MKLQAQNRLIIDQQEKNVEELGRTFLALYKKTQNQTTKFGVVINKATDALDAVVGFYLAQCDGLLVSSTSFSDAMNKLLKKQGYTIVFPDRPLENASGIASDAQTGRISILTSGTTGTPKIIPHTWKTLFTFGDTKSTPRTWLVTFTPGTYAWYQMITMGLFVANQQLVLASSHQPEDLWEEAVRTRVTAISATPTFWRYLFFKKKINAQELPPLEQITLGGEAADQPLLTRLAELFPQARITHTYASTEAGAAIFVHDRREGFPLNWLNQNTDEKPSIKLVDRQLWIKSPYASTGIHDWYNTGDLAEIRGDRVIIIGRQETGIINIGGQKASVKAVEDILLQAPTVEWCRVYGKKAPIVGTLVAADVVTNTPATPNLEEQLTRHCRQHQLAEWMIPRWWNFLSEIPLSGNLKSAVRTKDHDTKDS